MLDSNTLRHNKEVWSNPHLVSQTRSYRSWNTEVLNLWHTVSLLRMFYHLYFSIILSFPNTPNHSQAFDVCTELTFSSIITHFDFPNYLCRTNSRVASCNYSFPLILHNSSIFQQDLVEFVDSVNKTDREGESESQGNHYFDLLIQFLLRVGQTERTRQSATNIKSSEAEYTEYAWDSFCATQTDC